MSGSCSCALKVRDGASSVSVAVCRTHQSSAAQFRVRAWILSKGFLFNSSKEDTGDKAKNGLPTHPSPFFPAKQICSLESYVARHAKTSSVHLGVSLFVNGTASPFKHYFQYESPQLGTDIEMKARLKKAISEALRELHLTPSEAVVGSLAEALESWLPEFQLPVANAGSSPNFVAAVQSELDRRAAQEEDAGMEESKICNSCGLKCASGLSECPTCDASLEPEPGAVYTTTKNKRDGFSLFEPVQPSFKRAHVEEGVAGENNARNELDENMFTSTYDSFNVGTGTNVWPRTTLQPQKAFSGQSSWTTTLSPRNSSFSGSSISSSVSSVSSISSSSGNSSTSTNPFDELEEVQVTRHVFNVDPSSPSNNNEPVKMVINQPVEVKMHVSMEEGDTKESPALSGIGDVLNVSKYGEFLAQVKSLPVDFTSQYKLPRIVVIGSESVGKSSVLERIAMQPVFPRDRNLCTRCPIKLSLRRDSGADELEPVTVRFGKRTLTVLQSAVGDTVKALMNESVAELNGGLHGIVGEELVIEMRKPNVPTIDLIDLPGIVAASLPDEPGDMMKQTRELVERYVKDPNTLVVAVVPATIKRVRDAQAMQIVQAHNAQNRTIGVLTMADLVHDSFGNDPRWELRERLNGAAQDLVKLPAGYIAVKSRDMREGLSIAQAATQEQEWFKTHLSEFDRNERVSSVALVRQLDRFFTEHIRAKWVPDALKGLNERATALKNEAAALGPDPVELGLEAILQSVSSMNSIMEKSLARLLSETLKPIISACLVQPEISQNYATVARARQNASNRKACANLLNDQWFADTCINVAKQVIGRAFESSVYGVRIVRFTKLREILEEIAAECVVENMADFRRGILKRIKFIMPTVVEFLELVIECLFLPFFDNLALSPAQFQNLLIGRGATVAELLTESQEAQRRELNEANQNLLQASQVLKAL